METLAKRTEGPQGRVFSYARWSTPRQTWGDSLRRQTDLAAEWCQRHGRKLEDRSFNDSGVSAWKGRNRQEGNLAELLKEVQPTDTILVEDNDRISREDVTTALTSLRGIVSRGVKVVFMKTGVEVTADNFNDPSVLFPNFFQGYLANAESVKKSARVKASWDARKVAASEGKAVRQKLPSWLVWDAVQGKPVLVPERAEVVRHIFNLCLQGRGALSIVRQLASTPSITTHGKWSVSFVRDRVLRNKAVIGFNFAGKQVFPHVVSEEVFYSANAKISDRKHDTAPAASRDNNLFGPLARCAKCGRPLIRFNQKRKTGHSYTYLICSGTRTKTCDWKTIRYDRFEATFLALFADETKIRAALTGEASPAPSKLDVLKGQLATVQAKLNRMEAELEGDDWPKPCASGTASARPTGFAALRP